MLSKKGQMGSVTTRVQTLVSDLVEREGYELIDVDFVAERGRQVLRMYIDTIPPSEAGRAVGIEDCTHISRIVSDLLDVEDVVGGEYNLEVSSPGLFRPLTKPAHFDRAIGERIKVKTYAKQNDRRVFTGVLTRHVEGKLVVQVDGNDHELELADIAKANLEPSLEF